MSPMTKFSRLFIIAITFMALTLGGCGSYMPWLGDKDEEEDILSFEEDIPEDPDDEMATFGKDDPFIEDEPQSEGSGFEEEGMMGEEGFASIDQATDKKEMKADLENLQEQQEALISKVRELQEIISTLEPKISATQEQLAGSLGNVSQQADYLEPEVDELKGQMRRLQEELSALKIKKGSILKKSHRHKIPKRFKNEYDKALNAYRSSQYDESILMFQNLAVKNPPMSYQDNIHYWIGSNFVKLEMYDKAIEHFETILNQYPGGNKVHDSRYMLGVSYHRKGENSRAMDVLQSALKFNPSREVRSKIERELSSIQ